MNEKKIKVGDRVRVTSFCVKYEIEPIYGTVVSIEDYGIGVELDTPELLYLDARDIELAEPINPRTAFLQELKELLAKYNADIWADGGWDGCCLHLELDNGREKYNAKGGNLTHNEPIKLEDYSEM